MARTRYRLTVLGAAVLVATVVVAALWRLSWPSPRASPPAPVAGTENVRAEGWLTLAHHGTDAVTSRIGARVGPAAGAAGVAAPAELRRVMERTLASYLASDPSALAATLADQGTDPGRLARPDPDTLERWAKDTRLLRGGSFDPASVAVRRRLVGGRDRVAPVGNVMSAARENARPWLDHIPWDRRESVEVVIGGEWIDGDGGRFKGSIGYEFMWVPVQRTWALYRLHVYDFPPGRLGSIPPV